MLTLKNAVWPEVGSAQGARLGPSPVRKELLPSASSLFLQSVGWGLGWGLMWRAALTQSAAGACRGGRGCACVRFLGLPLQSIADGEANSTEIYSLTTWRLAVWDHGVCGVGGFWDLAGESALGLGPWRVGATPVLPSSAPRALPFHSDPTCTGWGPTVRQDDLIFVILLQRPCLQIQSCSVVLGLGPDHTPTIRDSSAHDRAGGAAPSASGGHRPHSLGPPCAGSPWTLPQPEQGLGP